MIDTASTLRDMLEKRRGHNASTGLLRLPFMLDPSLAERIEELGKQVAALEDHLDALADVEPMEDDPDRDIRASGHDLSPTATRAAAIEDSLRRSRADLEEAVAEADAARITLLFRRCTADEYEQLIRKHGGSSVQGGSPEERDFLNALTERCFVAIEMPDGTRDGMKWAEFIDSAQLSMGELAPIRAMVFAENARGGNSVPFSSASSRKTRSS